MPSLNCASASPEISATLYLPLERLVIFDSDAIAIRVADGKVEFRSRAPHYHSLLG